jgi:hypothetical protein
MNGLLRIVPNQGDGREWHLPELAIAVVPASSRNPSRWFDDPCQWRFVNYGDSYLILQCRNKVTVTVFIWKAIG